MKRILSLLAVLVVLVACNNQKKATSESQGYQTSSTALATYSLDSLLTVVDELADQKVVVRGHVTHVCKHSGKKCFIIGNNQEVTLRIESGAGFEGFDQELVGSEIAITGVVKKLRLSQEEVEEHAHEEGKEEACATELSNKNEMFYVEAESYEAIDR